MVGNVETNLSMRAAVSVIWPGKIDECKEYDNSLQSRSKGDSQLLKRPCARMKKTKRPDRKRSGLFQFMDPFIRGEGKGPSRR